MTLTVWKKTFATCVSNLNLTLYKSNDVIVLNLQKLSKEYAFHEIVNSFEFVPGVFFILFHLMQTIFSLKVSYGWLNFFCDTHQSQLNFKSEYFLSTLSLLKHVKAPGTVKKLLIVDWV